MGSSNEINATKFWLIPFWHLIFWVQRFEIETFKPQLPLGLTEGDITRSDLSEKIKNALESVVM